MDETLTDAQRFPLLNEAGERMLKRLREHPHAPRYNRAIGERLSEAGLEHIRAYAARQQSERAYWQPGELPDWLRELAAFCRRDVPFHRRRIDWSDDFFSLPPVERESLRREPWAFVPDSADLTDLIVYTTSGTTGTRLLIPANPIVPCRYLPLFATALAAFGVKLTGGERVSIVHVCAQLQTFILCSVVSYLDFAGFAKINLNPAEWNDPSQRVAFLDDCDAELYTGDPLALAELARLPLRTRPKAIISSGMTLTDGARLKLEAHFACPVVDIYSLHESGPVAFAHDGAHHVLPHDLYVEVLDPAGQPCPCGVRGEIVLSGGGNPLWPLLRYRTGDFAALDYSGPRVRLVGFEGRAPTWFMADDGRAFGSIDVSTALRHLPIEFFSLVQDSDGAIVFRTRCSQETQDAAAVELRRLFGPEIQLSIEQVDDRAARKGKPIQYKCDVPPNAARWT